jgi:hypothetical protein
LNGIGISGMKKLKAKKLYQEKMKINYIHGSTSDPKVEQSNTFEVFGLEDYTVSKKDLESGTRIALEIKIELVNCEVPEGIKFISIYKVGHSDFLRYIFANQLHKLIH